MKICTVCNVAKNLDDFGRDVRGREGREARCKACKQAQAVALRERRRAALPQPEPIPAGLKRCCHCREIRPLDQFKRARNRPDGYYPECKPCCKARYQANAAHNRAYAREYYWRDPEPYRERAKQQRATPEHREAARRLAEARAGRLPDNPTPGELRAREWYLRYRTEHAHKYREAYRRWVTSNPERYREYYRQWQKAHPENWIAQNHRRKARKRGNGGSFTPMQWRLLKARHAYTCLRCGQREPAITLQPDHVIPLAKGGSNDIANIQPLCGPCNRAKYVDCTDYRPEPSSA